MENVKEKEVQDVNRVEYVLLQDGRPFFAVLDPSLICSLISDRKFQFPGSAFSVAKVTTESYHYECE